MVKKALLITVFVLFTGILVYGAVNRTMAKTTDQTQVALAEGQGGGRGQNQGQASTGERQGLNSHEPLNQGASTGERRGLNSHEPLNQGASQERPGQGQQSSGQGQQGGGLGQQEQDQQGSGLGQQDQAGSKSGQGRQGGGNGQNSQANGNETQSLGQGGQGQGNGRSDQYRSTETAEITTLVGTVAQAPASGVDLILGTSAGEVEIGTGPDYLGDNGFVISAGEEITVSGYWEDGEFKATTITRADGTSIALRDSSGRPMWSGAARGGQSAQTS